MAQILAPYNNSMRLGQGFNSFTQQICMNDAVIQGESAPSPYDTPEDRPTGISQIVSYSSRFVDKLSDVTDAMNVSASLSIKTGTIGGSASGTYIDSDKFKTSDLNFFIQVKVTNQSHMERDYTKFQKLKNFPLTKFTEIYGDCFVSGWEEGGELNALLSVKVKDKTKTTKIQAALEASLGTPALSGAIKGEGSIDKSDIETSTETTITVNWSGGGQIKDANVIWDVNSLTLAASNFPDLVAMTPQRTYAILTKYTALKSFHETMGFFSPLDYENAGIYASALLDAYMDYKSLWKQIQTMNWEFENGTIALEKADPPKELIEYGNSIRPPPSASEVAVPSVGSAPASELGSENSENMWNVVTPPKKPFKPHVLECAPYSPTFVGLNKARRDCRLEMIKIVHEVDAVTNDPTIALDADRDWVYLSPAVFKQLLPVKKDAKRDVVKRIDPATGELFTELKDTFMKHGHRAKNYRLSGWTGNASMQENGVYFNNLEFLDKTYIMKGFTFYFNDYKLIGVEVEYTNGKKILNGTNGSQFRTESFVLGSIELVSQVKLKSHESDGGPTYVDAFYLTTNSDAFAALPPSRFMKNRLFSHTAVPPAGDGWKLRGFFGSYQPTAGIQQLGVIWGNEKPGDPSLEIGQSLFQPGAVGTKVKKLSDAVVKYTSKGDDYRLSRYAGDWSEDFKEGSEVFNALDTIDRTWKIQTITAFFSPDGNRLLKGIHVVYTNAKELKHGKCEGTETISWSAQGGRVKEVASRRSRSRGSSERLKSQESARALRFP